MKILFIGGTGTISTSCSRLAIEQGAELWLLNRGLRSGRAPHGARVIKGDINSPSEEVLTFLRSNQWDCVVNWVVHSPAEAERDIDLFRDGTAHYIFISSASVYRTPRNGQRLRETDPAENIQWAYARAKIQCEQIFNASLESGFPVTIVRPGHCYNEFTIPTNIPGLGYGLVRQMREDRDVLVHDEGQNQWTLTHSDDFASGFIGLIGRQDAIGETFHITNPVPLSWQSILDSIADILGVSPRYVYIPSNRIFTADPAIGGPLIWDRARSLAFDNDKIKRFVPQYRSETSFASGIRRSLEWHQQNPTLIRYDPGVMKAVQRIITKIASSPPKQEAANDG